MSEKIPVGMSAGGDNAFYHACKYVGHQKAYCVCLHLIERHKSGWKEGDVYQDCFMALDSRKCPALSMRREEIEAEHAIYYRPRKQVEIPVTKIDKSQLGYARGWNSVPGKLHDLPAGKPRPAPSKSKPKKVEEDSGIKDMDYSEVVDEMVAQERKKPQKAGGLLGVAQKMGDK